MAPVSEVEWLAVGTSLVSLVTLSAACQELQEETRVPIVQETRTGLGYIGIWV
jgi:hypothetical protein